MEHKKFRKLLKKYKKGSASVQEKKLIESFLDDMQNDGIDEQEISQDLHLRNQIYTKICEEISQRKVRLRSRWSIAASVLVILGISFLAYLMPQPELVEVVTERGEQRKILLADSSVVILNADSKLKYPKRFSKHQRKVFLEGEAFFKVKHQDNQTFVVQSKALQTLVLGTEFSVSSYQEIPPQVIVLKGKVRVSDSNDLESIVIQNQRVRLLDGILEKDSVAAKSSLLWIDGGLSFSEAGLLEVVQTLQRRLDLDIESTFKLEDVQGALSGNFSGQRIEDILKSIQFIFDIEFEIQKDHKITLTLKNNSTM